MSFDFIYTIIAFLAIFGVVVVVHEFGHFIVAKLNGIKVNEFSVGMGPKIFGFQWGDTYYALRLLPLGGACMFEGEDALYEADEDTKRKVEENPLDSVNAQKEGSFRAAPVWARMLVVLAGPFFNVILGYFLAMFVLAFWPTITTEIGEVPEGMPAYESGIREGDIITAINGENIYLFKEISLHTLVDGNEEWDVEVLRNGEKLNFSFHPAASESGYVIGVKAKEMYQAKGLKLFQYSWYEVRFWLKTTVKSLEMLVKGQLTKDDMKGPVGVAEVIGQTIVETKSDGFFVVFSNLVNIALLLSINLGVMNLLPLPVLDGGRFLLLLIEGILRKPIPAKLEIAVQMVSVVFLVLLMIFVMFNDIFNLFVS